MDEQPHLVIDRMRRSERQGKVFVDWSQNDSSGDLFRPVVDLDQRLPA